jgi:polyferredoxin
MKITTVRRISQVMFLVMFLWFAIVMTYGSEWWRLRGWPVNLFLQLDPLVGLGTILTTGTLYKGLLWGAGTLVLTMLIGRFFCGWLCPFGTMHQAVGWLAHRGKPVARKLELNSYHRGQAVKYYILLFFLGMSAFHVLGTGLMTGLLDPIPLVTRSVTLMALPIADSADKVVSSAQRYYVEAASILLVFLAALAMNLWRPRFFCRFICPTGALFGIFDRFSLLRIGKTHAHCTDCLLCEKACEGACHPAGNFRQSECVLCGNCLNDCRHGFITYGPARSAGGEVESPDISRRGFVLSIAAGAAAMPAIRLANSVGANYDPSLIRPPGSLPEEQFLERCIKCGQCMRICPSNVIQPAGIQHGIESLWTPALNNRIGSSGCQYNCTSCGNICPTAAIRPLKMDEKHGTGDFADKGPIKLGTAFVDRGRCLPWAMGRPCIVCQENCPVSPKAIYTTEEYQTIRDGERAVSASGDGWLTLTGPKMTARSLTTGDYFIVVPSLDAMPVMIVDNSADTVAGDPAHKWKTPPQAGVKVLLQVRLQKPWIDIHQCIGCGICEHECPVSGLRAVRVSAEGETRNQRSRLGLT